MRIIITIIIIAVLGWFGYWFVGSSAQETAMKSWLENQQSNGWVANYSELEVQGFPNRFDTNVTDLEIADPNYGWSWSAPQFQVSSLSYKPNHFIAVWPQDQVISTPYRKFSVSSSDMRGSLVFHPNTSLALDRATLTIKELSVKTSEDQKSTVGSAVLAVREKPELKNTYDIALDAVDFVPSNKMKNWLDPKSLLPASFDSMKLDTTMMFDKAWDKEAVENIKPDLMRLDITTFNAKWGKLQLDAKGSVDVDTLGYPSGKISLRAKNWKDMIALAVTNGAIEPGMAKTLETGLGLVAMLSGNKETLDIPLSFSNRIMSLGPIPIGKAPRLKRN